MKYALTLCLLALVDLAPAFAQDGDLRREPGYLDLEAIETWFDRDAKIEVNVKGALLRLVAEASRYEDPELADLLGKLKAVQVRGYDLSRSEYDTIERRTSALSKDLEGRGWEVVARVREDDEHVYMYLKTLDDVIAGLVVMVVSPQEDETVFVNIVGEIDPAQIGRIGRTFDIGPLGQDRAHRDAQRARRGGN